MFDWLKARQFENILYSSPKEAFEKCLKEVKKLRKDIARYYYEHHYNYEFSDDDVIISPVAKIQGKIAEAYAEAKEFIRAYQELERVEEVIKESCSAYIPKYYGFFGK
jgi:FMN-dependent NADH-azoreductase